MPTAWMQTTDRRDKPLVLNLANVSSITKHDRLTATVTFIDGTQVIVNHEFDALAHALTHEG